MMWESDNSIITGELLAVPFPSNPHGGSVFEDFARSPILLNYGFANKLWVWLTLLAQTLPFKRY